MAGTAAKNDRVPEGVGLLTEMSGYLPTGWVESTVGEALSIRNNLRLPISTEERLKIEGEFPYYGPTGILSHISSYRLDGEFATIGEDGDHFLKYRERCMTLLISGKFNVNNHAHVLASTDKCEASWFANYYMHRELTPFLTRQGAGRYKLTKAALERLPILLPPISEQRKIAAILSQWDDSLSILAQLIDAKRQQKRGLAEQLLTGKWRLPGFEEEWEESTMGTVFSRVRRKNTEGNDHALTISGVHGLIDQREFFNKRVAAKDLSSYYLLRRGEFAYNKSYSTGYDYGAIKRLNRYEAGVVSTLYICFALQREDAVSDFYEHFFEANLLNEGLAGIAQEGARNHGLLNVSVVDFFELPVPFPPPAEQQAIAAVLSTLDSEIAALEALKGKVAEQKRGLMDALLTGRVRVNVEDAS